MIFMIPLGAMIKYLKLLLVDVIIVHVMSVTRLLTRCHLGAKGATLQSFSG